MVDENVPDDEFAGLVEESSLGTAGARELRRSIPSSRAADVVERLTTLYPDPDITPGEFEQFVAELLGSTRDQVEDLHVTLHDKVKGIDGTYDFDTTVRFRFGGMDFLVIVEAKLHNYPIKRELVQVLKAKIDSVGAQKGVMVSTAPYQSGAMDYAKVHGIALVKVTEGRFTFETRGRDEGLAMTREEATAHGLPAFVAHAYVSRTISLVSAEDPERVAEILFGVAAK